ncbi:ABC transporter ATP-binding protein [Paraflavitalea soli]|uniref:ABC transporter ATP-binding protein n=1 Tax=Paraflavitalea soli TaxID=2315862 RepID=A0A3B7MGZ6_9BACT|nr:ABC transporter ATP-binding protein [Paraflavitalea soli]AXY72857.1 ABC transporter ATP-binding protein [Paraflavitalea soli]
MTASNNSKTNVWLSIYRLVQPYKTRLLAVFVISLVSTAITLLEPLIYREAVNDIAGLFVQKARNEVKTEMGLERETEEEPAASFFRNKGHKATEASGKKALHHKRVKEPHTKTHVAPRTSHEAFNTLLWAIILLFTINVLGLIFWWIGENMNIKLSATIERRFIQRTFSHVLKLPLAFFAKRSSAVLHKQIDQSEEISGTVTVFTKNIFPEIISLAGILAIMFWQNYVLALLALSIVPFYLIITVISTKKLEMSLAGYYEKWEEVSAEMQDALSGIKTVKLSGAEEREVNRLDKQATSAYGDYTKRSLLSNKYTFWQVLLTHIATAMVLTYGGYLALHHKLTPGDVVMFVAYLDMLYTPIDNLASIWAEVQQNIASVARAFTLLDTNIEEKPGAELLLHKGNVEFKNVHFGYTPEREVLKDLSFVAAPGKVTAIVGTSGAGKTTTVDLLLKLFEPQSGEILIDGQKLSALDAASVRRNIGMVAADGAIFRGTLADNIRYKKPEATDTEVETAAIAAGMQTTLQRLPDGLKTLVGESGFGLSVGERQRVQIARVIVSRPGILVMDEATANLDYATEAEVKNTIDEIRKENTVIIIAHRYSMVRDADHVIVLDAGQVAEAGTPATLIAKGGWFADFAIAGEDEYEEGDAALEEDEEDEEDIGE